MENDQKFVSIIEESSLSFRYLWKKTQKEKKNGEILKEIFNSKSIWSKDTNICETLMKMIEVDVIFSSSKWFFCQWKRVDVWL